jgi:hypothetical protein
MESIKNYIDKKEEADKQMFDDFYKKHKNNPFVNELMLVRFKAYFYSDMIKLTANSLNKKCFTNTRQSTYILFSLPFLTATSFFIINPFSILKKPLMIVSVLGPLGNLIFTWR